MTELLQRAAQSAEVRAALAADGLRPRKVGARDACGEVLVETVGLSKAFSKACESFIASATASEIRVIREAASANRGPRRDRASQKQPPRLEFLFHRDGSPTVTGDGLLAWYRKKGSIGPERDVAKATVQRATPASTGTRLEIVRLDSTLTVDRLEGVISRTPHYAPGDLRRLLSNTIGAIHKIPRVFHERDGVEYQPKHIEAYFGRSSAARGSSAENLYQRWTCGRDEREHEYGLLFARCSIDASKSFERSGIRVLRLLQEHNGLCISNRSQYEVGGVGSVEPGLLYMTFRLVRTHELPAHTITDEEIRDMILRKKLELHGDVEFAISFANDVNRLSEYKVIHYDRE